MLYFEKYDFSYSYGNEILYNFLYNPNGEMHRKFNLKKVSALTSYLRLLNYDLDADILNKIKYKCLFEGHIYAYLMTKINLDNKDLKTKLNKFKDQYYGDIKAEKSISRGKKISLWFMMHFTSLYCKIRRDV